MDSTASFTLAPSQGVNPSHSLPAVSPLSLHHCLELYIPLPPLPVPQQGCDQGLYITELGIRIPSPFPGQVLGAQ